MQTVSPIGAFVVAVTHGKDATATDRFLGIASPIGDFAMQGRVASQTGELQARAMASQPFQALQLARARVHAKGKWSLALAS